MSSTNNRKTGYDNFEQLPLTEIYKSMNIREQTEALEKLTFAEGATLSSESRGRAKPQQQCSIRTDFQRDRDRIIHSSAFRRLKDKTQVFINPIGGHCRTRLTHTLEVMQIARTIARAMRINEDLTEAIAMGHDLGHTPFGHIGERVLDRLSNNGFHHNLQSVRVTEILEHDGKGLNLTWEVKNGIVHHSTSTMGNSATLEGDVVRFADKIAYLNHDIDDAIQEGLLKNDDIPTEIINILGKTKSKRITTLILSIIENSVVKKNGIIQMSVEIDKSYKKLREFMFEEIYNNEKVNRGKDRAEEIISSLFEYYRKNPHQMSERYIKLIELYGLDKAICDYISGMTDDYAVSVFEVTGYRTNIT